MYASKTYLSINLCIPENRGAGNDKSNAGKSNEDPSDATNDLTHKYNVSIPEFSEELFDGHKGAAEEAASVNDNSLTQDQHLCDKGTDNVVKRTEGALDFHAMDGKPMRDDDLQKVGALADSSFCSEMIQNVNVNCFVSSPGCLCSIFFKKLMPSCSLCEFHE